MGMQKGSFSSGSQSATFAKQALAKQDYDRARMETLIQQNPVPGLGLSQQDLLSMYVYNTGAQNQWAMGNYANQIAGANAAYQNQVNTWSTLVTASVSLATSMAVWTELVWWSEATWSTASTWQDELRIYNRTS